MIKKIYKRLDSSNIMARSLIDVGEIKETWWIQAEEQYLGKGLGSNTWHSEKKQNITGSLVVFPENTKAEDQFILSMATSLAVCDFLELYTDKVRVKWPNDIYVGKKKIAGLLVEHTIQGDAIQNSILGMGLNINQVNFPENIPNPTSLRKIMGSHFDLVEVRELILACLENRVGKLSNTKYSIIKMEYEGKLYRYREIVPYRSEGKWFKARVYGVNTFGQLILETEHGEKLEFGFKEVEFIED